LEKALAIAKEIKVPTEVLLKVSLVKAAHKVIELTENLQQLVVDGANLNDAEEPQKEKNTCSEAAASKAPRGNTDSPNIYNIIEIGSSTTSASLCTSISTTSSDMDDIPLDKVYANLQKRLSPSSSTKYQKKPDNDTFVPMYPFVEERILDMQQRRMNACARVPADHPLQPRMIEPRQSIPTDAEVVGDQIGP